MLNWLSGGLINIARYVTPFTFALAVFVWFMMVRHQTNIKKNRKTLIKTGVYSLVGAASAPFLFILFTGSLFSFLSSSVKVIQHVDSFQSCKTVAVNTFKGFSITGGLLLLSLILLFVVKDAKKLTFAILYPFPVFAFMSRINCFIEGCCYGKFSDGPFAVTYPPASLASKHHYLKYGLPSRYVESLPVHPTQLYIIVSMILLSAAVMLMNRFNVKKNVIVGTVLSGYGLANFIIEFFREEPLLFHFLTMGQFMEIILFFLGFYVIFRVSSSAVSEA